MTAFIQPRVSDADWDVFIARLAPSNDERAVLSGLLAMYHDSLASLEDEILKRLQEAGIWGIIDAQRRGTPLAPDAMERIHRRCQGVFRDGLTRTYQSFTTLLSDTSAVIAKGPAAERFGGAARALKRRVILGSFRESPQHWRYAGEGVDLLALIEAAQHDDENDGEFTWLEAGNDRAVEERLAPLRERFGEIFAQYELETDRFIDAYGRSLRELVMDREAAGVRSRDTTAERYRKRLEQVWESHRTLNHSTAMRVAEIIALAVDRPVSNKWLDRYMQFAYPAIARPDSVDRMYRWVREELNAQENRETAVRQLDGEYESFRSRRRSVQLQQIAALRKARADSELSSISPLQTDHEALINAIVARQKLTEDTHGTLRAIAEPWGLAEKYEGRLARARREPDDAGWPSDYESPHERK